MFHHPGYKSTILGIKALSQGQGQRGEHPLAISHMEDCKFYFCQSFIFQKTSSGCELESSLFQQINRYILSCWDLHLVADHYLLTKAVLKSLCMVEDTEMRKWICVELNQRFPWNPSHWKREEREYEPSNYGHSYKGVHFLYDAVSHHAISRSHGKYFSYPKITSLNILIH